MPLFSEMEKNVRKSAIGGMSFAVPERTDETKFNIRHRERVFRHVRKKRLTMAKSFISFSHNEGATARQCANHALTSLNYLPSQFPSYGDYIEKISESYGGVTNFAKTMEYEKRNVDKKTLSTIAATSVFLIAIFLSIIGGIRAVVHPELALIYKSFLVVFCSVSLVLFAIHLNRIHQYFILFVENMIGKNYVTVSEAEKEVRRWTTVG